MHTVSLRNVDISVNESVKIGLDDALVCLCYFEIANQIYFLIFQPRASTCSRTHEHRHTDTHTPEVHRSTEDDLNEHTEHRT